MKRFAIPLLMLAVCVPACSEPPIAGLMTACGADRAGGDVPAGTGLWWKPDIGARIRWRSFPRGTDGSSAMPDEGPSRESQPSNSAGRLNRSPSEWITA